MARNQSNAMKADTKRALAIRSRAVTFGFGRRPRSASPIRCSVPFGLAFSTHFLIGWMSESPCYLIILAITMARASPSDIRYHSAMQDEGAYALLLLAVAAALVSLGAIFAELVGIKQTSPNYGFHVALALVTVTLSWTFTHAMFALHYAHDFYGTGRGRVPQVSRRRAAGLLGLRLFFLRDRH